MLIFNIHVAASLGHDQIVKVILSKQQCQELLTAKNSSGDLPLHVAANAGHLPIVQQLVNSNVNVACKLLKEKNKEGITPLHLALIKNDTSGEDKYTDVAKFLIDTGSKDGELIEFVKGQSLPKYKARLIQLFKQLFSVLYTTICNFPIFFYLYIFLQYLNNDTGNLLSNSQAR